TTKSASGIIGLNPFDLCQIPDRTIDDAELLADYPLIHKLLVDSGCDLTRHPCPALRSKTLIAEPTPTHRTMPVTEDIVPPWPITLLTGNRLRPSKLFRFRQWRNLGCGACIVQE